MEASTADHQKLEARVMATELVMTTLIDHHPEPKALQDQLLGLCEMLRNGPEEVGRKVADHLERTIRYLERPGEPG